MKMIFGQLKVTSNPDSAEIILDDEDTGKKTPFTFNQVLIGEHVVKVVKEGFSSQPDSSIVNISESATAEVDFTLTQNFGKLRVTSDTVSANIILDGQDTGQKTPHTFEQILEGDHVVKVYKQGYTAVPDSIVITVVKNQTAQANFTLAQDFGSLQVTSSPEEADIILDGQITGQKTPHTFQKVPVGEHMVKVLKSGYAPDSVAVTVVKDSTVQANLALTQNFGSLQVTSNPNQADIFIDGQNTGQQTPHTFQQVAVGEYVVKVLKSGFAPNPDSIVVTVMKDQTAQANFTLTQIFGGLRVTSTPNQADIILDGQNTGEITPHIFPEISVGDHVVKIEKQGYIPDQDSIIVAVSGGDTVDANFTMTQAATVQGNTYFASTTIPIPDVIVSVQNSKDTTDNNGYYFVDKIAPGTQILTATKPDFDNYNAMINLSPGMTLNKTIEMTSSVFTHTIMGQVTNSISSPVADAQVILLNPDNTASNLSDLTDLSGNYQISTVPEGNRRIKVEREYYADKIVDIVVAPGSTNFDVQLTANPLDPPANLAITADWNNITLNWEQVSAPTLAGYNVYRSQDQFAGYEKVNSTLITTNTFQEIIDTLTIPSSYYYKVSSVNIDGVESNLSDFAQYSTPTSWTGTAIWKGIFRLTEDFTVGENNTLSIENGSQILLKSSKRIVIQGQIFADATSNNRIYFLPYSGSALDIKFGFFSGSATGYFNYCVFKGKGTFDINIAGMDSVEVQNSTFLPAAAGDTALSMNVLQGRLNIKNCILSSVKGINVGVGVMNDTYLKIINSALFNSESGILGGTISTETIILSNNLFVSNGRSVKLPGPEAEANIDHNVLVNSPGSFTSQLGIAIEYWTVTQEIHDWDVTNNIIIDNRFGIFNNGSQTNSHSVQDHNDVWNNTIDYGGNLTNPGPNSISADPLFVNPDYMNPMNGDWNLQGGSPCLGAGSSGTDIGLLDPNNIGPQ